MTKVVNLRLARKRKSREDAARLAAENRIRYGRTPEQKRIEEISRLEAERRLDGLRRDPPTRKWPDIKKARFRGPEFRHPAARTGATGACCGLLLLRADESAVHFLAVGFCSGIRLLGEGLGLVGGDLGAVGGSAGFLRSAHGLVNLGLAGASGSAADGRQAEDGNGKGVLDGQHHGSLR